ncbi:MAG: ribulose-phosphate 3-epimerase [Planctomycetes bacterium]|nr:ribulose-phosphate 3-epimerase [Planctomycetota bacterium]
MPRRPILIAPSLLAADFACLGDELRRVEEAGADWLHVDVMDGHFVPNLTIGPVVVESLKQRARVPLDVHLMISEPRRYARAFVNAGAQVLTFHVETARDAADARETIALFRAEGVQRVGVSLNPDCPVERVLPLLGDVDLVLVMSVFAGFGGQRFLPETLAKTRAIRATGWTGYVEMDGGLNAETIPACAAAGADVLVSGSALFSAPDLREALTRFRAVAEAARGETIHA